MGENPNRQPLLQPSTPKCVAKIHPADEDTNLNRKVWIESKKLWKIVGPSIFSRIAAYSMNVVTQSFAGHLGEVELAAISIANTVIAGLDFGFFLGMASALETLCGQAFGAKKYHMLGVYMQRSWIILFVTSVVLLPLYLFAAPLMKLMGQTEEVAELSGMVALWMIPMHFSFVFSFPLQRFFQSQVRADVSAWASLAALVFHVFLNWLMVYRLKFGLVGIVIALDISWWLLVFLSLAYAVCGGCPRTWTGFSMEAFSGLWEFTKLSLSSGVMLW